MHVFVEVAMQAVDGTDGSWAAAQGGEGDEMLPTLLLEGMED